VQDDGRGFDVEAVLTGEEGYQDPRAQSLVTLKEKFELVRGTVSIVSSEADGTSVRMELPIND
jgi:signal transduction histidine kinase